MSRVSFFFLQIMTSLTSTIFFITIDFIDFFLNLAWQDLMMCNLVHGNNVCAKG